MSSRSDRHRHHREASSSRRDRSTERKAERPERSTSRSAGHTDMRTSSHSRRSERSRSVSRSPTRHGGAGGRHRKTKNERAVVEPRASETKVSMQRLTWSQAKRMRKGDALSVLMKQYEQPWSLIIGEISRIDRSEREIDLRKPWKGDIEALVWFDDDGYACVSNGSNPAYLMTFFPGDENE